MGASLVAPTISPTRDIDNTDLTANTVIRVGVRAHMQPRRWCSDEYHPNM
jgi:hypothetical protein